MTATDWLIIAAILLGPVIALAVTRHLDRRAAGRTAKLEVFRSLMSSRAHTTSWQHVEALNRIDVEFTRGDEREAAVLEAWTRYAEFLSDSSAPMPDWGSRRIELLTDLLERMAHALDMPFDRKRVVASSAMRLPLKPSADP